MKTEVINANLSSNQWFFRLLQKTGKKLDDAQIRVEIKAVLPDCVHLF